MRVLDANFLIDYLNGVPVAEAYYEEHDGPEELSVRAARIADEYRGL